ncbi:MAG TPA: bifunctional UDP-3-O-[3-hydroxymyristoyl] N-acetylglucosamine deacetylase/3-hydroxyacyl-ACP dehydratase [Bacteroidales bacterium]|nr:bifunctional UDP-3-O-[3-hydroxymyristoyl] N-acetylglucosamine deacetylase/3-hydroxyacyl-ACP dehydratase [Bacteroidales bacterium]HPS17129.1 bifunctional UDP-3-O-[3-hydroxymyristoyl] N-acetylglucosamine deacetylase/3-hydroxyacyl-ACP dehydratase [Bacteroidales bacterium]
MVKKQKTIKNPITVSGVGLHSGEEVNITFLPAPVNHGYKFRRIDLEGKPIIDADTFNVVDTSRGTTIEQNGVRVQTVEHTLAALSGLEIDNILIELDKPEPPILDGSSKIYVDALIKAGIVEQDAERKYFKISENILYRDPVKKVEIIAIPSDEFKVSVMIDFETNVLGTQNASITDMSCFTDEIASSRTFVFLHELESLVNNNQIKGGDLNNAMVFVNRVISDEELTRLASLFKRKKVEVLKEGILNNIELRYSNEPARHKLLDVIGDLALVGMPLKAHIIANRPGHHSNVEFAKIIRQLIRQTRNKKEAFQYDVNAKPIYDINQIRKILPHRYPFLLIDKILDISDSHVIGLKNVTANEEFFTGHFPSEPVMPGVLQIEAMAQTGGVFFLHQKPDPENYNTLFLKIDDAKFKHKVCPGDTLIFDLRLISPLRRGICQMKGIAYVGNKIVMEAELTALISKNKES